MVDDVPMGFKYLAQGHLYIRRKQGPNHNPEVDGQLPYQLSYSYPVNSPDCTNVKLKIKC